MIVGIGVDLVDIEDLRRAVAEGAGTRRLGTVTV